jgi:DNA-binding MarR family transcriptional regulator
MDAANLGNVLGALALRLSDELRTAVVGPERDATAMTALVHLAKYPGESIEGLRVPLELTHSGGVRLVNRLVTAGYVDRHEGADARAVALRLTRKGKEVAGKVLARREEVLARVMQVLSSSEREVLAGLVSRLLVNEVPTAAVALRTCRLCDYDACRQCPIGKA